MRKVFLDNFPKTYKGISWNECIGLDLKFIYDNLAGEFKILNYNKPKLILSYNGVILSTNTNNIINCKLGVLLGKIAKEFKCEIGKDFKDNRRDITIIDKNAKKDTNITSISVINVVMWIG